MHALHRRPQSVQIQIIQRDTGRMQLQGGIKLLGSADEDV